MRSLIKSAALASASLLVATAVLAAPGGRGDSGGPSPGGTGALGTASVSFGMSASVAVTPATEQCENNPGPFIRLDGSITLGGLDARIRFSNNMRGTHAHDEDISTTVELVSDGPIVFSKQPSRGGVGGNPHVWLQLQDCTSGAATTDYVYLGRCVQGLSMANLDSIVDALGSLYVTTGECSGAGGPNITLSGALTLGGICAQVVFTNNEAFTHVHAEDVTVEVPLIPAGQSIVFSKSPHLGGAGGNPHVFVQFLTGDGIEIGSEIYLGRCNKLD